MSNAALRSPATGKERELLLREECYFEVARRIFLEEGFHALTLSRVAEGTGYSKATVYLRFKCREELIAELALRCQHELLSVMEQGLEFPGRPRERIVAMSECIRHYAQLCAEDLRILRTIDAETVLPRVSEKLQAEALQVKLRTFGTLLRPIEEAISAGDLKLAPSIKPQSLCLSFWTMVTGWSTVVTNGPPAEAIGLTDLLGELQRNCYYLLDGVGWRPLTSEWDYDETIRRVRSMLLSGASSEGSNDPELRE